MDRAYHVLTVKNDELEVVGYTEDQANSTAKQLLAYHDGCSTVVVKYIRIFSCEPRVRVHEVEQDVTYFE